ncbi:MAG TPA: N-acetylmuramoyl-L-alanine amidase [Burkholderiaceae bacterium]|jgi:N-acetylmuramoyl-L-alanine amidase
MKKTLLCAASALFLSACATGPLGMWGASHEFTSVNQDSRAQFLILHYTAINWPASQRALTNAGSGVSAHYLVRDEPAAIYQLVDENRRAWQAGASYWASNQNLNSASIGIEIVNLGFTETPGEPGTPPNRVYYPFPQAQIDEVIRLTKDIVARNHITPDHVLGHQDIAPGRKSDPGPLFPWKQFYAAGIIPWPDAAQVAAKQAQYEQAGLPDATWAQDRLGRFGYDVPHTGMADPKTKSVILTFQMKYRSAKFDGEMDAETAALIDVATTPGGMVMAPQPPSVASAATAAPK